MEGGQGGQPDRQLLVMNINYFLQRQPAQRRINHFFGIADIWTDSPKRARQTACSLHTTTLPTAGGPQPRDSPAREPPQPCLALASRHTCPQKAVTHSMWEERDGLLGITSCFKEADPKLWLAMQVSPS